MKIFLITILIINTIFAAGCKQIKPTQETQQQHEKRIKKANILQKKYVLKRIWYIKDKRTGFCFGYYYEFDYRAESMGLTHVPCNRIPKELLNMEE